MEASAPPLGLLKSATYEVVHTDLKPEDLLLAYTDGVTESSSHFGKEMFGERRLRNWLQQHHDMDVREIPEQLLQALNSFGRNDQDDDLTLLCMKRNNG